MKKEGGYTVAELVVAMGLVVLISTLCAGAYVFVVGETRDWRKNVHLNNSAHLILRRIAEDARFSSGIEVARNGEVDFIQTTRDTIRYVHVANHLTRNGHRMHDEAMIVDTFSISAVEHSGSMDVSQERLHAILLTLSTGERRLTIGTAVLPRGRPDWASRNDTVTAGLQRRNHEAY